MPERKCQTARCAAAADREVECGLTAKRLGSGIKPYDCQRYRGESRGESRGKSRGEGRGIGVKTGVKAGG